MQTSQRPYSELPLCLTCGGVLPYCLTCKDKTTNENISKMEMLEEKVNAMNQTYEMLSSTLVSLTSINDQCNPGDMLPPSMFLRYIHTEIYVPLMFKDWNQLDGSSKAASLDSYIVHPNM